MTRRWSRDVRLVLAAQAGRAFAYGLGAVLLGRVLAARASPGAVGLVLGSTIAGIALASVWVARRADRIGRRRSYVLLYAVLGCVGLVFAFASSVWVMAVAGLTGTLSAEVIESGPFTSLEQAMLATDLAGSRRVHGFGVYNAVAALAGSVGALGAALPARVGVVWPWAADEQRWFLLFVPVSLLGMLLGSRMSRGVEPPAPPPGSPPLRPGGLGPSRSRVRRLGGLFAIDSFAGGLTVTAFVSYYLTTRYHASAGTLAFTFFALGLLGTGSFLVAPLLADTFGLLPTMVFTHLPSDVFLAAIAFAPSLGWAVALLAARACLSQMDVPTRQTYVMALVEPPERTAAAAYTNSVRYLTRPFGPPVAEAASTVFLGLPFLLSGVIKAGYDLVLWTWFRRVPVDTSS